MSVIAAVIERLIDPAFDDIGIALWWAVTTVTTVGYGDIVPESHAGRAAASVLMLTGLALIPTLTSIVVATLVAQRPRGSGRRSSPSSTSWSRCCGASTSGSSGSSAAATRRASSAELLGEEREHVVRLRVAADHLLLEDELAVDVDVEDAAGARHELHRVDVVLVQLEDPRRQTDGVRPRASGNAVLDANVRPGRHRRHPTRLGRGYASRTTGGPRKSSSADRWPIGSLTGGTVVSRSAAVSDVRASGPVA